MLRKSNLKAKFKLIEKLVVVLLIISLTCTNLLIVGNALISYAIDSDLDSQNENTISENVKFNTYFDEGNGKTHYLVYDVNNTEKQMYMNLSVKDGYLKDAVIEFNDMNYTISNIIDESEILQGATENKLTLRQIDTDTSANLVLTINKKIEEKMEVNSLDRNTKVVLKGIYVDNEGEEQNIEKEIFLNVKLTGKYEMDLKQFVNSYLLFNDNNKTKALVSIKVEAGLKETKNRLPIKNTKIEIQVPKLNGIEAEDARVLVKGTKATNGETIEENGGVTLN